MSRWTFAIVLLGFGVLTLTGVTDRHLTPYHRERVDRDQIRFLARLTLAVSALAAYVGGLHAMGVL